MKPLLIILVGLSCCFVKKGLAQSTTTLYSSATIQEKLDQLEQNKRLLYIGIMPGEENSLLLTAMQKKYHFQTAYFMLTRGEQQENYCGPEKGIDLGIIHTAEMQAAGQIGHFELYASSYMDVGTRDSSTLFKIWNRQHLLSDMVAVIRSYHPDIIVIGKTDPTDSSASWLQHLCLEANQLAANEQAPTLKKQIDPAKTKDSTATSSIDQQPFAASWIFAEAPSEHQRELGGVGDPRVDSIKDASKNIEGSDLIKVNLTGYDSVSGMTYREIALKSKQAERSIFADLNNIPLGQDTLYLQLIAGKGLPDLEDGSSYGIWARLQEGQTGQKQAFALLAQNTQHPQLRTNLLPGLETLYSSILKSGAKDVDSQILIAQLKSLLISCSGLRIEAYADRDLGVLGHDFQLQVELHNPLTPLAVHRIVLGDLMDTILAPNTLNIARGKNLSLHKKIHLPLFQAAYQPFWLNKPLNDDASYQIDPLMQGRLADTTCYRVQLSIQLDSLPINVSIPLVYKQFDRFKGEQMHSFYTVEPLLILQSPDVLLTHIEGDTKPFKHPEITLRMKTLFQDSSILAIIKIRQLGLKGKVYGQVLKTGETQEIYKEVTYLSPAYNQNMHIALPYNEAFAKKWDPQTPILKPQVLLRFPEGGQAFSSNIKTVEYPYQKNTIYNFHSQTIVIGDTIRTKGSKIAYIGGVTEDAWENALHQLGYRVTELTPGDLLKISPLDELSPVEMVGDTSSNIRLSDSLKQFDAVVWNFLPANSGPSPVMLKKLRVLLNAYVNNGGRLLNLSTQEDWLQVMPGNDSISKMVVLNDTNTNRISAQNPNEIFNYPNQVSADHFLNWYGRIAYGSVHSDSRSEKSPIQLQDIIDKERFYPLSLQKSGNGSVVNCFLDLPTPFSNGSPFAFKFLANLLANPPENLLERQKNKKPISKDR